ncbi:MAG TPA: ActD-like protein, partial [Polyangia bacterium]|nr:ActD-like protein [Polyangia bacterium]
LRLRAAERRPTRPWLFALPLALAGAAALGLIARPSTRAGTPRPEGDVVFETTEIKGASELRVYRHRASGDERLADGSRAAAGDLLQLAYRAPTDGFGALLSIDGRGHVTLHWPEPGAGGAARLSAKGEVRLPSAYELDDAPAFERFVFVSSPAPFDLKTVLDAAEALAARPADARARPLTLPAPLNQLSLALDKPRKEIP